MPPRYVWRRSTGKPTAPASQEPGSVHEDHDTLSRQQRQLETHIYAPGGVFYQVQPASSLHMDGPQTAELDNEVIDADFDNTDAGGEKALGLEDGEKTTGFSHTQRKREQQWRRWSEKVIPKMLQPYVSLLRETNSLRDLSSARSQEICGGCTDHSSLEVSCIYFESKS